MDSDQADNFTQQAVFLTARWEHLVMVNYVINPQVLAPYVPRGTELDSWSGTTFVSLIAFRFLDTRVLGVGVPFHRDFEEINLRFYVRRRGPEGWRRGVVFIREVVPKQAIASVAKWLYNENYVACPTRSEMVEPTGESAGTVAYGWRHHGEWLGLAAGIAGVPVLPTAGSQEEFITEHYWGYSRQRDGGTVEYQVEHPTWRLWEATGVELIGDIQGFYGDDFAETFAGRSTSAFVAEGSPITVRKGSRIS